MLIPLHEQVKLKKNIFKSYAFSFMFSNEKAISNSVSGSDVLCPHLSQEAEKKYVALKLFK